MVIFCGDFSYFEMETLLKLYLSYQVIDTILKNGFEKICMIPHF